MKISSLIITKNSEDKIENCLQSIKDLGEEIIVLDTGSTDKTLEICKKYDARIFKNKGEGY